MKVTFNSNNDVRFDINLEPETMQEAGQLVRFAMNATKKLEIAETIVYRDGTFQTWIGIGCRRITNGTIKP